MRYVAILCPRGESLAWLEENVRREKRWELGGGCYIVGGHGPPPETFEVQPGTTDGLIRTGSPERFAAANLTLWLPHTLFRNFGPGEPETIVMRRQEQRPAFFKRVPAGDLGGSAGTTPTVRTPHDLLWRFSTGALFRRCATPYAQRKGEYTLSIGGAGDDAARRVEGVLAPWQATLDTERCVDGAGQHGDCLGNWPVDYHVDFPAEDWLRVRLHGLLCEQWSTWSESVKKEMPPVPRLLFGAQDLRFPRRARAFLILDALSGAFGIEEFASAVENPRFTWMPPVNHLSPGLAGQPADRDVSREPLVTQSIEALGLTLPAKRRVDDMTGTGSFSPSLRGPEAAAHGDGVTAEKTVKSICRRIFDDDNPPEILTQLCEAGMTDAEAQAIEAMEASGDEGDGEVGVGGNIFVQRLVDRHLIPRSSVRVMFPTAPDVLGKNGRAEWSRIRQERRFDPARRERSELRQQRQRLAAWWLHLIQPEFPDGQRNSKRTALPEAWPVDRWWKRHFRVALFREAPIFKPRWQAIHDPRLGEVRLGEVVLGNRGRAVASYPGSRVSPEPTVIDYD